MQSHTSIQLAARLNQPDTILLLMKYGADVHQATEEGNALHVACAEDHLETVQMLLEQGVSLSVQNANGDTPLHVCAVHGSMNAMFEVLRWLNEGIEGAANSEEERAKEREEVKKVMNI